MNIKNRLQKLEKISSAGSGEVYLVTITPGGAYQVDNKLLKKEEFDQFKEANNKSLFVISRIPRPRRCENELKQ